MGKAKDSEHQYEKLNQTIHDFNMDQISKFSQDQWDLQLYQEALGWHHFNNEVNNWFNETNEKIWNWIDKIKICDQLINSHNETHWQDNLSDQLKETYDDFVDTLADELKKTQ